MLLPPAGTGSRTTQSPAAASHNQLLFQIGRAQDGGGGQGGEQEAEELSRSVGGGAGGG